MCECDIVCVVLYEWQRAVENRYKKRYFMFYFDSWEIFNCFCEFTMEAKLVGECQSEKIKKYIFALILFVAT